MLFRGCRFKGGELIRWKARMRSEAKHDLKAIGAAIREARRHLDVSQEDFAELADLHRTYVGQLERGEKNMSYTNLRRVARALSLKPSELLRRAGI